MAKKKRLINALDWIKRAPAVQLQRMREGLADLPGAGLDIEKHIASLEWGPDVTDREKTLVAGNLRHFNALLSLRATESRPKGTVVLDGAVMVSVPRAYALIPGPSDGGVPSWHLLKLKIEDGVVTGVDKSDQNLRPVHLQAIEDDILRDA